jgi:Peptidase inhibitor family I36
MRSRAGLLAGTALLAGMAVAAPAAVAQQHSVDVITGQGRAACHHGQVCLYENDALNQFRSALVLRADRNLTSLVPLRLNDGASSVCNFTNRVIALYGDTSFQGRAVLFMPDVCRDIPESFNDRASSLRFI